MNRVLGVVAVIGLVAPVLVSNAAPQEPAAAGRAAEAGDCAVTAPSGGHPNGNHGNAALATTLWLGGTVEFKPGGPGCVEPDGYLGMKWPWWRAEPGALKIEGRRLDGSTGPLRAHVPSSYGNTGFQPTGLLFSSPGCWEVTGSVGDASLTFVTRVVKIENGPSPRCEMLLGGFRSGSTINQ